MTEPFSRAFQAFLACRADSKASFMRTPSLKSAQQATCSRLPLNWKGQICQDMGKVLIRQRS